VDVVNCVVTTAIGREADVIGLSRRGPLRAAVARGVANRPGVPAGLAQSSTPKFAPG
jgi:hypothetical protein